MVDDARRLLLPLPNVLYKLLSLLQKSLSVIPEVFIGNPVCFKNKDFWIPAAYGTYCWLRGYDGKSVWCDTFARASNGILNKTDLIVEDRRKWIL